MTDSQLRSRSSLMLGVAFLLALVGSSLAAAAEASRVLPAGELPHDRRLGPLKNLDGYFPFTSCPTKEAWNVRAERLRRQLLVATGLWPMPTKTPANAVIYGPVDREQYTVEKVFLQSFPGHYVTGNLYRPKGHGGRLPGVLCPHGHWANGRFHQEGEKEVEKQIADGAEKFAIGGRYPLQARCVQLARMGCVVFHYDMLGHADSIQLKHRPGVREAMNTPENWGYFSPQAEAHLQNMMGLQTYNSIRALDWLSELSDVDPQRIGVTGASGGGTQTFILCAIDPRPAVAFPAVMVSTAMQGGCTCENACYLRVGTGNVEIAALIAPRPLGMTAADDWTKEIATKGLPELKQHYKMLGVENRVMARPLLQFKHNYNYPSRAVMYDWFNTHLKLGLKETIVEEDFKPLSISELSVWDAQHQKPPAGDDYERSLLKWITGDSQKQLSALMPKDDATLAAYRRIVGGAIDVLIGRGLPDSAAVTSSKPEESQIGDWTLSKFLVRYAAEGEEVPAVRLQPKSWNRRVVIWIDKTGKQGLFGADGKPKPAVEKLLKAGVAVVGVDLFGQGEFTADGRPLAKQQINDGGHGAANAYAGFTFGYNHPLFSQRVHDILSVIALVRGGQSRAEKVDLVGLEGAGHWVAAACAQAGAAVDRAAIDTAGFRFAALTAIDHPDFLPGGAKYGDLPGILALSAPMPLWLAGEGDEAPKLLAAAYKTAGQQGSLVLFAGKKDKEKAAVEWLLQ